MSLIRHPRRERQRFLCPSCLRFGAIRFACQACGLEIDPFIVHTQGWTTDLCPHCEATLELRREPVRQRVRAYCGHCPARCDPMIYHRRGVRVLAAFAFDDLLALHQTTAVPVSRRPGVVCGYDDGERLTYLLSADDLPRGGRSLPRDHAARAVAGIWLDAGAADPLGLGGDVDRLIQRAGWTHAQRRGMTVSLRVNALGGAAYRMLTARFGALQWEVTAARFLSLAGWPVTCRMPPRADPSLWAACPDFPSIAADRAGAR